MSLSLASPPGYGPLVLLDRRTHRSLGVRRDATRFAANLHVLYVTVAEFVAAARCYPLVFVAAPDQRIHPFVLVGLEPGQNLAVDAAGAWLADNYCPAYVRRYPFCTVEIKQGDSQTTAICVDEQGLEATPPYLFDAAGNESPRWREIQRFITDMDNARRQTDWFCAQLVELDLLEDFEADINPAHGRRQRLVGLRRVSEDRLKALPEARIKTLMQNGSLARIYAHLMSLENFHRLLQLDAARRGPGGSTRVP